MLARSDILLGKKSEPTSNIFHCYARLQGRQSFKLRVIPASGELMLRSRTTHCYKRPQCRLFALIVTFLSLPYRLLEYSGSNVVGKKLLGAIFFSIDAVGEKKRLQRLSRQLVQKNTRRFAAHTYHARLPQQTKSKCMSLPVPGEIFRVTAVPCWLILLGLDHRKVRLITTVDH